MRIFLTCLQSLKPHALPAYDFWEVYFKRGIEEAGHQWIEAPGVDWAEGMTLNDETGLSRWRERTWSRALEFIRQELQSGPVDLLLGYLYPEMIEPGAIREIRKLGIPCVNFFCDNVREFRKVPHPFHCFDLHWVPEHQALAMYGAAGLKCLHAPMPCWIPPDQRTCDHPETQGVTFIGSPDELRRHLLGRAIELGADINIFGFGWRGESRLPLASSPVPKTPRRFVHNQWQHIRRLGLGSWFLKFVPLLRPLPQPPIPVERLRGKIPAADLVRVMQQSVVTLGINRVQTFRHSIHSPITYSRLRDIEAPMTGACYLTEWAEGLEHFYALGEEIETYRTPEELVAKIQELLASPDKRHRLRRAGQQKALRQLSVTASLERIIAALGLRELQSSK